MRSTDVFLAMLLAVVVGCSTARPLLPLTPGDWALEASFPGVWVASDAASFPVGIAVLGGRFGVAENMELRLAWHPMLALQGLIMLEAGGILHVLPRADGLLPGLHVQLDMNAVSSPAHYGRQGVAAWRGAAAATATVHWEPWAYLWPYIVSQHALILAEFTYAPSVMVGLQVRPWQFLEVSLETGWAGFATDTHSLTQPYLGIAGRGGIWTAAAITLRWDALREAFKNGGLEP